MTSVWHWTKDTGATWFQLRPGTNWGGSKLHFSFLMSTVTCVNYKRKSHPLLLIICCCIILLQVLLFSPLGVFRWTKFWSILGSICIRLHLRHIWNVDRAQVFKYWFKFTVPCETERSYLAHMKAYIYSFWFFKPDLYLWRWFIH